MVRKIRKLGYNALVVPTAKVYHGIEPVRGLQSLLRGVQIVEPARAYFVGRNRIVFMRRHRTKMFFLVHVAVFLPFLTVIHTLGVASSKTFKPTQLIGPYLRGVLDGLSMRVKFGRELLNQSAEP